MRVVATWKSNHWVIDLPGENETFAMRADDIADTVRAWKADTDGGAVDPDLQVDVDLVIPAADKFARQERDMTNRAETNDFQARLAKLHRLETLQKAFGSIAAVAEHEGLAPKTIKNVMADIRRERSERSGAGRQIAEGRSQLPSR